MAQNLHISKKFDYQLETAIKDMKKTYEDADKTINTNLKAETKTYKEAVKSTAHSKGKFENAWSYYRDVEEVYFLVSTSNLLAQNVAAISAIASTDAVTVSKSTDAAAKAIDVALQSIAKLASDIASISAMLNTEDKATDMDRLAQLSLAISKGAVNEAEQASLIALNLAIESAKTKAAHAKDVVTLAVTDTGSLAKAVTATFTDAQAKAIASDTALVGAVTTEYGELLKIETLTVDKNSTDSVLSFISKDLKAFDTQLHKEFEDEKEKKAPAAKKS